MNRKPVNQTIEPTPQPGKLAVTISEAADLLSVSPVTIRRAISKGQIKPIRLGDLRVPMSEIHRILNIAPTSNGAK